MKKLLIALAIIFTALLIMGSPVIAKSRGECKQDATTQTASASITSSGGLFHGIIFATDGSNNVTVNIYDNASAASGTELIPETIITTSATNRVATISIDPPVRFHNGMYVSITCDGTVAYKAYWEND